MLAGDGLSADLGLELPRGGQVRIVGGLESSPDAWPWMASLQRGAHFCGASLVAPDALVTAAHCVEGNAPRELRVVLGRSDLSTSAGKSHQVAEIIVHPEYDPFSNDADVAILMLTTPSDLEPLPILQASDEALAAPDTLATVIGWGVTQESGSSPDRLREVRVPIVSNEVANRPGSYAGAVTPRMLAAGLAAGGKDSCQGDSGGPLMVSDAEGRSYLAGIVSWGDGCARPNKYGIYTRVSSVANWIVERTQVASAGSLNFIQERYTAGQIAELKLTDADLAGQGSVTIELSTDTGDVESLTMIETLPGRFAGAIPIREAAVIAGNDQLDALGGVLLAATYLDADDGKGHSVTVRDTARIIVDDYGNDAQRAAQLEIAQPVAGEIELDGDVDWFRFSVLADKSYGLNVLLNGSLNDSVLELYDDSGETLLDSDDDGGAGLASSLIYRPGRDGFAFAQVAGYGSNVGTYQLEVNQFDASADDHGATSETATPIALGAGTAGSIELPFDQDWFVFDATEAQTYQVTTRLGSLGDSVIRLIGNDGSTELDFDDDSGDGLASRIVWRASKSGTYFVEVSGFDSSVGTYELTIEAIDASVDDHGNGRFDATPINFPSATAGDLESIGDTDWFEFIATVGVTYEFSTELIGLNDSTLRLLNRGGIELEFNDDNGFGFDSQITWTAPSSGNYYIEVAGFLEDDLGTYLLTATSDGDTILDDHGATPETATLAEPFLPVAGQIDFRGDVDWFQFEALAGVVYDVQTTGGSLGDTVLRLLDQDGFTELARDDDSGDGFASALQWHAVQSATYFIEVSAYQDDLGSYQLSVSIPLGDANLDGTFDSADLTQIFQRGQYDDGIPGNSTWADGDWDGDGEFSSSDLVAAFQAGRYEQPAARDRVLADRAFLA